MSKATRKDLLNSQDEFITTTSSAMKWVKDNPLRFAIITIVIIAVFAGALGVKYWRTARTNAAMIAYSNAVNSSQLTLNVIQSFPDSKAAKLANLRLAQMAYNEKNSKMAVDYAQKFLNAWGKDDLFAWQGALIMSAAYLDQRQYDKALSAVSACATNAPKNIKDQALFYKAQALMGLGKKAEAKKALSEISDSYQEIAIPSLASLEMHQGEPVNAK